MESNLKNLEWSFPQALKSMTDQDFNESDVQTKKASITFLGRNITSTLGIQLFKFLSIVIPLVPTLVLVLYNGIQVGNIWVFSPLVPKKHISFAQLVLLSLYVFWEKCVYFSILNDKIIFLSERRHYDSFLFFTFIRCQL